MNKAKSKRWWLRPIFEARCYKMWNVICPGIVWKAYALDLGGCVAVFAVDEVDCFAQYCPEKLELVIDFWRRYKWIEGKLDI